VVGNQPLCVDVGRQHQRRLGEIAVDAGFHVDFGVAVGCDQPWIKRVVSDPPIGTVAEKIDVIQIGERRELVFLPMLGEFHFHRKRGRTMILATRLAKLLELGEEIEFFSAGMAASSRRGRRRDRIPCGLKCFRK
jgi:hypothetical protein